MTRAVLASTMFCVAALASVTAAADDAGLELFEKKIRPVLVAKCYQCHTAEGIKTSKGRQPPGGGLQLDHREAMRAGGDSGPAVVPGNPDESLILEALRHESFEMPPDERLPAAVVADFVKWIELGAPDPREGQTAPQRQQIDLEKGRQFWAFQPPQAPAVPPVQQTNWPRSDIDRFLLAAAEQKGLTPAADADRATLIRRVYFDLIGLPPAPADIEAFVNDQSPDALAAVVDRLLASKHFGERWGRHWLDVARFAESSGGGRTRVFKDAWRYRDYVVSSFNRDKPFDQFVREQIAGDLLPADSPQQQAEQFVATGFLVLGPTNYELQDKELLRMEVVDEQIDVMGRAFLGMTLGCARCHDHKFDPIPTTDYYALAGIFRSTKTLTPGNVSGFETRQLPATGSSAEEVRRHEALVKAAQDELNRAKAELAALQKQLPGGATNSVGGGAKNRAVDSLAGIVVDDTQAELVGDWTSSTSEPTFIGERYLHDENTGKGEKSATFKPNFPQAGEYEVRLSFTSSTNRASNVPVMIRHAGGETVVMVNQRKPLPSDGSLLSLGRFRFEKGGSGAIVMQTAGTDGYVIVDAVQIVPAGGAKLAEKPEADSSDQNEAARRAELLAKLKPQIAAAEGKIKPLEKKLADLKKKAPQRAVAMAVRDEAKPGDYFVCIRGSVHKLGDKVPRGFMTVTSESNQPPDIDAAESGRRELADWLASEKNPLTTRVIVNRIWLHLFGQGIVRTPDNFGSMGERPSHPELLDHLATTFVDDGWSVKRMIRRIVLSRAYQMNSRISPAAARLDPENRLLSHANRRRLDAEAIRDAILFLSGRLDAGYGGSTVEKINSEFGHTFTGVRRSIYVPVFRNTLHPLLAVFDVADPNLVTGRRSSSTLATQALYLMNSPFVQDQSRYTAERILADGELGDDERLAKLYLQTLGRLPHAGERKVAVEFLREMATDAEGQPAAARQLQAWTHLCQSVFSSIDFRYLD